MQMMEKRKRQTSGGEEHETNVRCGRARDRQVKGESNRHISAGEEQETNK